ncbi:MAG: L-threonylcarbamoyladenylate synthase [Flavobacteriaceae bacterium]|nr:threonylcarbamoyl-AMP synthase [Flavobacteriaceae bacterium]
MLREVEQTVKFLKNREVILYPTDTVWGLGCDATDAETVKKIFKIKQRDESKSLVILVDSIEMLQQYIPSIPNQVYEVLRTSSKPTSIIYDNPIGLANNVIASDNTVAIRIVQHEFCQELIKQFGKPIVSTSANISGMPTPISFKEIDKSILDAVDYVVNLQQNSVADSPSRILKITDSGELQVIRD